MATAAGSGMPCRLKILSWYAARPRRSFDGEGSHNGQYLRNRGEGFLNDLRHMRAVLTASDEPSPTAM
jgi:hypothetical protein